MFSRIRLLHVASMHNRCRCSCHNGPHNVRVRFAPSPTGQLHLGGLRTALYNYLFARKNGGKFILRMEDTDQTRLIPGAQENLLKVLQWAQIQIDEGPDVPGEYGPYVQSERLDLYRGMVNRLLENKSAYKCFCTEHRLRLSRNEAIQRGETPKYDNRCRHLTEDEIEENLSEGRPYTVRLKLQTYTQPWSDMVYGSIVYDVASLEGDPILMKSDGYPTYHLANVVDDHHMKISHVLRGVEWQVSTTKHMLLYKAFGWEPPQFAHLPLLMNKDGKKLSKRQGDSDVQHYINQGYHPETILNMLTDVGSGFKVKSTAGMNIHELIENFDLSLMRTNSTRLDFDKLPDINRKQFLRRLEDEGSLRALVNEFYEQYSEKFSTEMQAAVQEVHKKPDRDYVVHVLKSMKNRISSIQDLLKPENMYLWSPPTNNKFPAKVNKVTMLMIVEGAINIIKNMDTFEEDDLKVKLKELSDTNGLQFGQSMKVLRAALSSSKIGPSIAEMMIILGKKNTTVRLEQSRNLINTQT